MSGCDICGYWRDEVVMEIGNAQAERGDFDLAIRTAKSLKKSAHYYGDEVIKTVARGHARAGSIETALKTTKEFRSSHYRSETYQYIAYEWVKKGDRDKALSWAAKLPSRLEKAYVLVGIAQGIIDQQKKTSFIIRHLGTPSISTLWD
jgi:lipopolysaccharide biosynthesis regulator YciM